MSIDKKAADHIQHLEEENYALSVQNGILLDVVDEQEELIRSMKAQIQFLQNAQKVDLGVA